MVSRVCLVIVTFNRSELLSEMLDSVNNLTVKPKELFVVDNNSSDDTKYNKFDSVAIRCFAESNLSWEAQMLKIKEYIERSD